MYINDIYNGNTATQNNNIEINLQASENRRCNIQLQKETEDGLVDIQCGARVQEAGLCK